MAKVKINNNYYNFLEEITILDACKKIGIDIPTLCYLKGVNEEASCRMCVVEVNHRDNLVIACKTNITDGMEINTNSPKVLNARRKTLELLLANHNKECLSCNKNNQCELQRLARIYNVDENKYPYIFKDYERDSSTPYLVRDNSKCILCNRCVAFCKNISGVEAIKRIDRGVDTHIGSVMELPLSKTKCVGCGGCVSVCPTGALSIKDDTSRVIDALNDPTKHVIGFYAPAVRTSVGEAFDIVGKNCEGKINSALKLMGFAKVFDVTSAADLTTIEEANELLDRMMYNKNLPMFTSCCPAWVNYVTYNYPNYVKNLSTCKSPQKMFGAICKTYYAKKYNIKASDIVVVSIMPCTAKKGEILKNDNATNYMDIDISITTQELISLINKMGLNFNLLPDSDTDLPFKDKKGILYGTSGGVMENALIYAMEELNKKKLSNVDFYELHNNKSIKEGIYNFNGTVIKTLTVNGLKNIQELIKNDEIKKYDFIEVMACPSGCINGAGQVFVP